MAAEAGDAPGPLGIQLLIIKTTRNEQLSATLRVIIWRPDIFISKISNKSEDIALKLKGISDFGNGYV